MAFSPAMCHTEVLTFKQKAQSAPCPADMADMTKLPLSSCAKGCSSELETLIALHDTLQSCIACHEDCMAPAMRAMHS